MRNKENKLEIRTKNGRKIKTKKDKVYYYSEGSSPIFLKKSEIILDYLKLENAPLVIEYTRPWNSKEIFSRDSIESIKFLY